RPGAARRPARRRSKATRRPPSATCRPVPGRPAAASVAITPRRRKPGSRSPTRPLDLGPLDAGPGPSAQEFRQRLGPAFPDLLHHRPPARDPLAFHDGAKRVGELMAPPVVGGPARAG